MALRFIAPGRKSASEKCPPSAEQLRVFLPFSSPSLLLLILLLFAEDSSHSSPFTLYSLSSAKQTHYKQTRTLPIASHALLRNAHLLALLFVPLFVAAAAAAHLPSRYALRA